MTFHCTCNIDEKECGYPNCNKGRQPEVDALTVKLVKANVLVEDLREGLENEREYTAWLRAELQRVRQILDAADQGTEMFWFLRDGFVKCKTAPNGSLYWYGRPRFIGEGNTFEEAVVNRMREEE